MINDLQLRLASSILNAIASHIEVGALELPQNRRDAIRAAVEHIRTANDQLFNYRIAGAGGRDDDSEEEKNG